MTTEELKAHRRAICAALIEGITVQVKDNEGEWGEGVDASVPALWLFDGRHERVRIKPEPRKVWVGWRGSEYVPIFAEDEESFRYMSNKYPAYNWQLVEEQE